MKILDHFIIITITRNEEDALKVFVLAQRLHNRKDYIGIDITLLVRGSGRIMFAESNDEAGFLKIVVKILIVFVYAT